MACFAQRFHCLPKLSITPQNGGKKTDEFTGQKSSENWPKLLGPHVTFDVVSASRLVFAAETEDIDLQNLAKDLGPHMALPSRDLLTANYRQLNHGNPAMSQSTRSSSKHMIISSSCRGLRNLASNC